MSLLFPDLNVWLALSDKEHAHNAVAWAWLNGLAEGSILIFSRYTQIGLLRLLTNKSVMSNKTLLLREAWVVYDSWLEDMRVEFYPDPRDVDAAFRRATKPFAAEAATKWVGDCWLVAYAEATQAKLVTFDRGLHNFARKRECGAVMPA